MRHQSIIERRGSVTFPEFTGERVYMREFRKADGLPADLRRWQRTVDLMLEGVDADGPIYLMVDQAPVVSGAPHRRPGVHIDGLWNPGIQAHGNPSRPGHRSHIHEISGQQEAVILASTVTACRGFAGAWDGEPGEGGDCSHVDLRHLATVPMLAGQVYAGNVTMLHESLPVQSDCLRTLVRLNVPGWSPLP